MIFITNNYFQMDESECLILKAIMFFDPTAHQLNHATIKTVKQLRNQVILNFGSHRKLENKRSIQI
jgi:hypothetical protein